MAGISAMNGWLSKVWQAGDENSASTEELAETIEAGDFRIDVPSRSVTLRGRALDLTTEEFDVLVFLAAHRKSIVTPHTMLATDWGRGRVRQAEFLRVLMSLAKKLDSESGAMRHYIRTEPWIVYRFDPEASSIP
jgi:two-component system, OmpR family, KDP operon response regulator KdpE